MSGDTEAANGLSAQLAAVGFSCSVATAGEGILDIIETDPPEAVVLGLDSRRELLLRLPRRIKEARSMPIVALVPVDAIEELDASMPIDDFAVMPCEAPEVALRLRRALWRKEGVERGQLVDCGELVIDIEACEVIVSGRPVPLTFKEYELVKLLALNRGRVYTREELLSAVWGYDYFGGDRTVDVHVRRLRSKIEDSEHVFIETVRNVGYRFRKLSLAEQSQDC